MVVAAIVFPTECGLVGELLFLDEVDPAQLCGVHVHLDRQHFDHPLDEVHRLGHAEGTAVADPARRFVGVDTVNSQIRGWDVIRARADIHETCGELRRVSASVKAAVVRGHFAPQAGDLAFGRSRDFALHPVVAGKGGGHQVFHPVFDPLHRNAGDDRSNDRTNVAGIRADLVAKAPADIRRDDADVVLFDARNQADDRPDRVRCLERAIEGQLAVHLVHRGHTAAGFQRARVRAVVVHGLFGDDLSAVDDLAGGFFLADFPCEDVVVMFAWSMSAVRQRAVLGHQILAQNGVRFHRFKRIDNHRQFFVVHVDQFDRVGCDVAVLGHHIGNLLALEQNLAVGQNHLLVACQGRHPVQTQGPQIVRSQNRNDPVQGECSRCVDRLDPRMGIGRSDKVPEQHPRHFDVVNVVAFALCETGILDALALAAHATQRFDALLACNSCIVLHSAASLDALISAAAARMDFTMFW